ncbi:GumC family protein [Nitrosococcus watsonii]|uniref:Lipopolysaccharide biosynthesis protein n=1 Tax=Nitrosococcus watsoni (strain C-113) TaxID=105559 RepID=D8KBE3_NITWC|nr:GumC family protein [Nitrosococcus watsonii]ADJ29590.1 lipopolysaccharide biosynthesis protein [Nitrosococcus watsonii C-113]
MNSAIASNISLRDFIQVVFKRKFQILISFIASVGLGILLSIIAKPQYEAEAKLLVNIGRENFYTPAVPINEQRSTVFVPNREEQINSEIEILKSQYLIEKVVDALGPAQIYPELKKTENAHGQEEAIAREVVKRVKNKDLKVEKVPQSNVINVSFRNENPILAAKLVNTLVDLYFERHLDMHLNSETSEFYQTQSEILGERLKQAEARLQSLMNQYKVSAPETEQNLLLQQIVKLESELHQTLTGEADTEKRITELRRQLARAPRTISLYEEFDNSPPLTNRLEAKLIELEIKEKELLAKYNEESRVIQNIREQIRIVMGKLAEQGHRQHSRNRSGVNPVYQSLLEELSQAEVSLRGLKASRISQLAHLKEYKKRLSDLNWVRIEFSNLQRKLMTDRQNYQLYLTRLEESRISSAMNAEKISNVSLLDPAKPPLNPVSPKLLLNIVLSILVGSIGGLALAFLWQYVDDKLERESDVEEFIGLPVLASVPERN